VNEHRLISALALCAGLAGVACDETSPADAGVDAQVLDAGSIDGGDAALVAEAGDSFYATVGEVARLDGSASVGATSYQWVFGDGRGWDAPRPVSEAEVIYASAGRYRAFLTVTDAAGRRHTNSVLVSITEPATHTPAASGSVAV